MSTKRLLNAKATTGYGSWISFDKNIFTVTAELSNTTTPAATLYLEWTPDAGTTTVQIASIALSGAADKAAATFEMAPGSIRMKVHAISGTSATASAKVRY